MGTELHKKLRIRASPRSRRHREIVGPAATTVPIVDISVLAGPRRSDAIALLAAAARDVGIARLVNHGVDVAGARDAGVRYFELPEALKGCSACSVRNASTGFQRGRLERAGGRAGQVAVASADRRAWGCSLARSP